MWRDIPSGLEPIAKAAVGIRAKCIIMVVPPVDMIPFDETVFITNLKLVVTGSGDEFASVDRIKTLVAAWNPVAAVDIIISGADHFFVGREERLKKILARYI